MLKRKLNIILIMLILMAILFKTAMVFFGYDLIFIALFLFVLMVAFMFIKAKSYQKKIDWYFCEKCDPERYLFEFSSFFGYNEKKKKSHFYNVAKLKAYIALGRFNDAFAIADRINERKIRKKGILYAEYLRCMVELAIYANEYDSAEEYHAKISCIKNKKYEPVIKQLRAELLRMQNENEKARALYHSLVFLKRSKKDMLTSKLAVAYIDRAEGHESSAIKNFEIVAREANTLYIRELARREVRALIRR